MSNQELKRMKNENLKDARKKKNDEFYTQYHDIEKEMNAYLDFDKNVFRDKTILLPCDDPEWSNFTKYFAQNFERLGLKRLISTSYAPESKPEELNLQLTLFETQSPKFDKAKARANGKIYTLTRDTTGDKKINVEDLEWEYLKGDGDFRSAEVTALRDEADIIITNPPFSLFREFLEWIVAADKQFSIIGNMNAITYKETFPLIKENRVWLGNNARVNGGAMFYEIPESIANPDQVREIITDETGKKRYITRVQGVRWFTNIEHGVRHTEIKLMSESDNKRFSKHKEIKGIGYQKYDNFDALEVPYVDAIPSDYRGIIGVPISILDKYNPEQFEIVGNMDDHSDMRQIGGQPISQEFMDGYRAAGGTGAQRAGGYWVGLTNPHRFPYKRIFIKHRKAV